MSIQVLRGLAAMLVVLDHGLTGLHPSGPDPDTLTLIAWHCGGLGVSIFFVISGFIMVHTAVKDRSGPAVAGRFFYRRVLRIVPLYWLATGLTTALAIARHKALPAGYLLCSLFFIATPLPGGGDFMPVLNQGWTLNYEMAFYVVFGLALLLPPRFVVWTLCGIMAAVVAIGACVKPLTDTTGAGTVFGFYTDPIILLFAAGALLGLLRRRRSLPVWFTPTQCMALNALLVAVGLLSLAAAGVPAVDPLWLRAWLAALSVLCVVCGLTERGEKPNPLTHLVMRLGDASFSIYLFHNFVLLSADRALRLVWRDAPDPVRLAFMLMAAAAVGYVIHRLVERPLVAFLRRRIEGDRKLAAEPAAPASATPRA